jgi:twitching motility protein PilT
MQLIQGRKGLDMHDLSEIDLGLAVQGRRFRINIYRESGSFAIAVRVITIDHLGLPPIVKQLINQNSGLFLVTGPTGSGKSTTIASLINHINTTRREHIITLEDPIEFIFPDSLSLVDQREHGIDFKNWPSALRSILRQDPDIVFVGEMRDFESIASTVTISETGHLVFATLHTNSSAQTIDRIIDVFPNEKQEQIRTQLSNVISAVISQRLVPTITGSRTLAYEIMVATPAVKNAIRESKAFQIDNIIQTSQDYGMISLERSLAHLVRTGVIALEVAQRTANNREALNILLKQS